MSCNQPGCLNQIEGSCNLCQKTTYFCCAHLGTHRNETGHLPKFLEQEQVKMILLKLFKSEIENCIIQMTLNTEEVIRALKRASNEAIKALKNSSKHIGSITETISKSFSKERISFLVEEVGQISKDFKHSTPMKLRENSEVIESLKKQLQEKEKSFRDIDTLKKTLKALEEEQEREREKERQRQIKGRL